MWGASNPRLDEALAQLAGATVFSKLDANSGFWQNPLLPESHPLTTFIMPFERYHFNKLPIGISIAPELFQKRRNSILEGLEGVVCLMDDVLVVGKDKAEHDSMQTIASSGETGSYWSNDQLLIMCLQAVLSEVPGTFGQWRRSQSRSWEN